MVNRYGVNFAFVILVMLTALLLSGYSNDSGKQSMVVTATAYTIGPEETKADHIGLAAWGDQLKSGMKAIAVSRDLIDEGLDYMTKVTIEGLEGTYIVRDKMNKRWENRIDIFMGNDVAVARAWGKRQVTIHWTNPPEE